MKNQTGRYFKYAIGEILLVMIGILLAFQVDTWRDSNLEKQKEIKTVELLIRDLKEDYRDLTVFQEKLNTSQKSIKRLISLIESKQEDSLASSIQPALFIWNYRPSYPTYKGLVQGNNLGVIKKDILRDSMIIYFDERITYLDDLRANYKDAGKRLEEAFEPFMSYAYTEKALWTSTVINDPEGLLNDLKLKSRISKHGKASNFLLIRIESFFLPSNKQMQKELENYLEELKGYK